MPADIPHVGNDDAATLMARLEALARAHQLPAGSAARLLTLLQAVRDSPHSLTAVREPATAIDVHVADSLAGLAIPEVRSARTLADLGSGAGFPGLVLAVALPDARVFVVESVGKKAAFLTEAADAVGAANVEVVAGRAEDWQAGIGACDVVTARALASLAVLVEYAAPLLAPEGVLVAWKGRRDAVEEEAAVTAATQVGMGAPAAVLMPQTAGAARHLYLSRKVGPTPPGFPRRAGSARKRPLGGST